MEGPGCGNWATEECSKRYISPRPALGLGLAVPGSPRPMEDDVSQGPELEVAAKATPAIPG